MNRNRRDSAAFQKMVRRYCALFDKGKIEQADEFFERAIRPYLNVRMIAEELEDYFRVNSEEVEELGEDESEVLTYSRVKT